MKTIKTKLFASLALAMFISLTAFATAPEQLSYQAVIKDASNNLVVSHAIGLKISILQTTSSGTVVYSETHAPTSNTSGLVSVVIGTGTVVSGTFASINWSTGTYFIKSEIDPTGGTSYTVTGTTQLQSVPYALHAKTVDNAFSGSYNDLSDRPTLFDGTWTALSNKPTLFDGSWTALTDKPTYATVATSGSYNDLSDKPSIANTQWTTTGSDIYYNNGNVGIGTTTPTTKLDVSGEVNFSENLTINKNIKWANSGYGIQLSFATVGPKDALVSRSASGSQWVDVGSDAAWTGVTLAANGGNVGIGTTTPVYKLDVNGAINASSVLVNGVAVASSTDTYWSTAGSGKIQYSGGNIGIGTATPAYPLDVNGDVNVTGTFRINGTAMSGTGTVTSVDASGGTTGLTFSGGPVTTSGTMTMAGTLAVANGGTGSTTAAGARTSLGATTVGSNLFTLTNPSAITFPRFNADNTVSVLTAANFRTAIGAGTGSGTVTGVTGTAPIVSSGGTAPVISISAATTSAAGSMSAADKTKLDGIATSANNYTHPTGDGNLHVIANSTTNSGKVLTAGATAGSLSWTTPTTGTVTSVTGTSPISVATGTTTPTISLGIVPIANGGTGATTAAAARTALGTASSGLNSDITGLTGLTTDITVAQGGTGTSTGSITGTGALTFAAGGTNTNVTLTPNGTGYVDIAGGNGTTKKLNITDASTLDASASLLINKTGAITGNGYGVNAIVSGGSNFSGALRGQANGTGANNMGVIGYGTGAATNNYGVYSIANSGTSKNYGVFGAAQGSTGTNYGGYFENTSTANAYKYGIYSGTSGAMANYNYAVFGLASGSTLQNIGVYGLANVATTGTNTGGVFNASGGGANYALITSGGNVGLGTTTPAYQLDVAGDVNLTGMLRVNGAAGTAGQYLKSNGASDPTWADVTATTATNIAGGSAGTIPYQSAAGTTAQLAAGTSGYLLKSNGAAAPSWLASVPVANGGTGATTATAARTSLGAAASGANSDITSLTGLTTDITVAQGGTGTSAATVAGGVVYGASTTAMASTAAGTAGQVLTSNGTSAPTWKTRDYALAGKTADQSITTSPVDVVWAPTNTTLIGEITLDATGTYFTLHAGKTYELQASLYGVFTVANASMAYRWVDNTNTAIGTPNVQGETLSTSYSTVNVSGQQTAITVITPAVDTQVKLRMTSGTYVNYIPKTPSFARIMQLQ